MVTAFLCALLLAQTPSTSEESASQESIRHFETTVRPLLIEHCHKCHSDTKQWANLRLDSREAMLKGGDNGPAIVPGNPTKAC